MIRIRLVLSPPGASENAPTDSSKGVIGGDEEDQLYDPVPEEAPELSDDEKAERTAQRRKHIVLIRYIDAEGLRTSLVIPPNIDPFDPNASGNTQGQIANEVRTPSITPRVTLIEMIIVSAMFITVMAAMIGFISAGIENITYVTQEARKGREGPAIVNLISRDLSNAMVDSRLEKFFILEDGDNNAQLHFVTSLDSSMFVNAKRSAVVETGYWLEENNLAPNDGTKSWYTLFRREDYGLDEEPIEGGKAIPIASNVVSFKVEAYDYPVDDEGQPLEDITLDELKLGSSSELERKDSWEIVGGGIIDYAEALAHANTFRRLPYCVRIQITLDIREGGEVAKTEAEAEGLVTYVTTVTLPNYGLFVPDNSDPSDDETGVFANIKLNPKPAAPEEGNNANANANGNGNGNGNNANGNGTNGNGNGTNGNTPPTGG